jgi:hypothetical protein
MLTKNKRYISKDKKYFENILKISITYDRRTGDRGILRHCQTGEAATAPSVMALLRLLMGGMGSAWNANGLHGVPGGSYT